MADSMPDAVSRRHFLAVAAAATASAAFASRATASTTHAVPNDHALPHDSTRGTGGVVLFQGDSVTDVGRNKASTKPNDLGGLGNGYPLLIASEIMRVDANTPWQFYNRGVSGNKVPDLDKRWDTDTLALKPDVLSLLIGVNDYWHTKSLGYTGTAADFETQLTALLARTRTALPSVRLVVLEPFVLKVGAVDDSWFPAFTERQAIVARVAKAAKATFIGLQAPLTRAAQSTGPAHWAADGVHPTPAGHAFIAEQWRAAVKL